MSKRETMKIAVYECIYDYYGGGFIFIHADKLDKYKERYEPFKGSFEFLGVFDLPLDFCKALGLTESEIIESYHIE